MEKTINIVQINTAKKIEKIIEYSLLYDFYGELLKEQNKEIYEDYILNDLSLGEIAQNKGISRQGVHDIIKRCNKQLFHYETKLNLVEKFKKTKHRVNEIKELTYKIKYSGDLQAIEKIEEISNHILEEM